MANLISTTPRGRYSLAMLENLIGAERGTIGQVWAARAKSTPDATYLRYHDREWTYGEAWQRIRGFAGAVQRFASRQDRKHDEQLRIAALAPNSPDVLWAWQGTATAGATYSGLNPQLTGVFLNKALALLDPHIVILNAELADRANWKETCPNCELIVVIGDLSGIDLDIPTSSIADFSEPFDAGVLNSVDPSNLCGLMMTSGTTGNSKSVAQPHNMIVRGATRFATAIRLLPQDVIHHWFPTYHVGGQIHFGLAPVIAGCSLAMTDRMSIANFWQECADWGCTITGGLKSTINLLLSNPPNDDQLARLKLRLGAYGPAGGKAIIEKFESKYGISVVDTFGMTEAEVVTLPPADGKAPAGTVGVVCPDFEMLIANADGSRVVPGTPGEILIRPNEPDVMMHGYHRMPEETLRVFKNLWFHTGDIGVMDDDGFLRIVGREKHMVRRRGENISISEIEDFFDNHPDVAQVVAIGVGEDIGEQDVKIIIEPQGNFEDLDLNDVASWCKDELPRFMVPRWLAKTVKVPLTEVGKPDRMFISDGGLSEIVEIEIS